jgi:hypothetical protein
MRRKVKTDLSFENASQNQSAKMSLWQKCHCGKNVTARIAKPNNPPEFKQPAGVQTTRRSSNNPPEFFA